MYSVVIQCPDKKLEEKGLILAPNSQFRFIIAGKSSEELQAVKSQEQKEKIHAKLILHT